MALQTQSLFSQTKKNLSDFDENETLTCLKTKCNKLLQYNQFSIESDDKKIIKDVINSINKVQHHRKILASENEETRYDNGKPKYKGFLEINYITQTNQCEIEKHTNIIKNKLNDFLQKQSISQNSKNNNLLKILEKIKTLLNQLLLLISPQKSDTNKKEILKDIENHKNSLSLPRNFYQ